MKVDTFFARTFFATLFFAFTVVDLPAQTLKFQFGFEDSGTNTTDSVAGIVLNTVDASGNGADFHGTNGSGVAGLGKALDFSSNPWQSPAAGPLASTVNNSSINFGTVSNFTTTLWLKPDSSLSVSNVFPRIFLLVPNGITDLGPGDIAIVGNGQYFGANVDSIELQVNGGLVDCTNALPVGQWRFLGMTFDNAGKTLKLWSGSETNSISLVYQNTNFTTVPPNLGAAFSLFLGNRPSRSRSFDGRLDDVRFYTGTGDSNFVETVRKSVLVLQPKIIVSKSGTNILLTWPGGGTLQSATNAIGTYTNMTGATSPFTVTNASGARKFFRVKVQ